MNAVLIHESGTCEALDLDLDNLAAVQGIVGGYIEVIRLAAPMLGTMIVNEDGKQHGLPVNELATRIAVLPAPGDFIVGRALIVGPADANGDTTPISRWDTDILNNLARRTA